MNRLLTIGFLIFLCFAISARNIHEKCLHVCQALSYSKTTCKKVCDGKKRALVPLSIPMADINNENDGITSEQLWDMYRSELIKALTFGKNDRPLLQILQIAEDAVWDQDRTALERFCDYVPYWGQYYSRSPYQISRQYSDWLNEISMGQDIVNQQAYEMLEKKRQNWKLLSAEMATIRKQCVVNVGRSKPANKEQFDNQMNACLKDIKTKVEDSNFLIEYYSLQAYSVISNDLISARQRVAEGMSYRESQNSLTRFRAGQGGQSIRVTVSNSNSWKQSSTWETIARKGIPMPDNLQRPFFSNPHNRMPTMITTTQQFRLELDIPAFTIIQVSPGDWFRKSLIQSYNSRSYINDPEIGKRMFGDGGTMKLMPKALFVVKNPSMTLTLDRRDEALFNNNQIKSSGGLFSSSREDLKISKRYTSDNMLRITLSANKDVPQVIAVDNDILP